MQNKNSKTVVLIYAPWCGHCKTLKPIWDQVKTEFLKSNADAKIIEVNSDDDPETVKNLGVEGFPTILMIDGKKKITYDGDRSPESLKQFLSQLVSIAKTGGGKKNQSVQSGGFIKLENTKSTYTNLSIFSAVMTAVFFFLSQQH